MKHGDLKVELVPLPAEFFDRNEIAMPQTRLDYGPETPSATIEGQPSRLRWPFLTLYALTLITCYLVAIVPSTLALAVRANEIDPSHGSTVFSLAFGVGLIVSLPTAPIIGHLSDATRSRFGRRRPWIVGGSIAVLLSAWLVASASSAWMLLLGWALMSIANNAVLVPLLSVIPDRVPTAQRGFVSGLAATTQGAAAAACLVVTQLFSGSTEMLLAPALIALGCGILFSVALRSDRLPSRVQRLDLRQAMSSLMFNPRRAPRLGWALLFTFLVSFGMAPVTSFMYFFIQATLAQDPADVAHLTALATALIAGAGVVSAPLAGNLADKTGRQKLILSGGVLFVAIACVIFMITSSIAAFIIAALVFGIGSGVVGGGTVSLISSAVEGPDTAARDLGLGTLAISLPLGIVAAAQPVIVGIGGFTAMFAIGLIAPLAALLLLPRLSVAR